MDQVQTKLAGIRTMLVVYGDSFLVAVAITAAVSTAVILGTSLSAGF